MSIPYQIAIVGMSGKGKTMAFRNMNPETCGFINAEGKPLPFINKFKHYLLLIVGRKLIRNLSNLAKIQRLQKWYWTVFPLTQTACLKQQEK